MENLRRIEQQVLHASSAKSLAECRSELNECLATLREESKRQQQNTSQMVSRLHSELNHNNNATTRNQTEIDPVTGLPSRPDAESMLASQYGGNHTNTFAVVFSVHRINLINTKYGYAAGDQIMRGFLNHLRGCLTIVDDLFRWSGPAFLAIVHRPLDAKGGYGHASICG